MADDKKEPTEKERSELAWTVAAISALIAAGIGWYLKPFGGQLESAALLASVAVISFSIRELIVRNRK